MVNSADFTKRIHKIMEKNDLNASSFAEAIHVGRSSISHILSGRNKPSLDLVMNIVDQFPEVDLYWLLNGKGSYPKKEMIETPAAQPVAPTVKKEDKIETTAAVNPPVTPSPDLFSTPKPEITKETETLIKGKNISKIIVLYSDGSFKDYFPE
ncbi:DNA-binding protein [Nonlabens ulvanivorans]|uniref:DNA-binding XRE family transcriptional regulator n=2 Tax=Nonlabens ulvanivorans TaxID=906888 RepID=A0A084JWX7_NONUL|nr:DNA-binding protein [Nonlabens ulvanivorans]PRX14051.1 DNA-binding XRE family transcriptional regulator [Nonlabens ulvanivorans]